MMTFNGNRNNAFQGRQHLFWRALVLFLLALVVRMAFLGRENLWLDEALSLNEALQTPQQIVYNRWDQHPPLYYLFLHYWIYFGQTETILRLPSVFCGALSVPLLYLLGRQFFSETTGRLAALILALSPVAIWYAQEVRMYALAGLFSLVAIYCFCGIFYGQGGISWLGYILSMTLGLYSHYTTVIILGLLNVIMFSYWLAAGPARRHFSLLRWSLAQAAVLILYLPWLTTMSRHWGLIRAQTTYPLWILTTPGVLIGLGIISVLIIGSLMLWFRNPDRRLFKGRPWLLGWGVMMFLIFYLGTVYLILINRMATLTRQTFVMLPIVYLGFAALVIRLPNWRRWAVGVLCLSLAASLASGLLIQKPPWQSAARLVRQEFAPGDVVILSPSWLTIPFQYYARGRMPVIGIQPGQLETRMPGFEADHSRAWLILQEKEERWTDPERTVRTWFHNHYPLEAEETLGLLDIARFSWSPEHPAD